MQNLSKRSSLFKGRDCTRRLEWLLQVKAHFRPEFVNRVDDFVVFEALKLGEIKQIVRLQAKRVEDRLKDKKMRLELTDSAIDYLAVRPALTLLWLEPKLS